MELDGLRSWFNKQGDTVKAAVITATIGLLGLCITGCFSILNTLIQRPTQSTNPTQVLLIINATPIPTFTPEPTFLPQYTSTPILSNSPTSVTPPQSSTNELPLPSADSQPQQSKFNVIWSNWVISIIQYLPQNTWLVVTIVLGGLFFIAGIAFFISMYDTFSYNRTFFIIGMAIFVFVVSINQWGWWGILWGFLIFYSGMMILFINRLFGGAVGMTAGILIGISISLFTMAWSGYLSTAPITSWSIIGGSIGMLIGIFTIKGSVIE